MSKFNKLNKEKINNFLKKLRSILKRKLFLNIILNSSLPVSTFFIWKIYTFFARLKKINYFLIIKENNF